METSLVNVVFTNIHRLSALVVVALLFNPAWCERFRKLLMGMALVSLITGAHKFGVEMRNAFPGWHMWAGIKVLLALHVVAMAFLLGRGTGEASKRERWRKGAMATSLLTAALGLWVAHFAK